MWEQSTKTPQSSVLQHKKYLFITIHVFMFSAKQVFNAQFVFPLGFLCFLIVCFFLEQYVRNFGFGLFLMILCLLVLVSPVVIMFYSVLCSVPVVPMYYKSLFVPQSALSIFPISLPDPSTPVLCYSGHSCSHFPSLVPFYLVCLFQFTHLSSFMNAHAESGLFLCFP